MRLHRIMSDQPINTDLRSCPIDTQEQMRALEKTRSQFLDVTSHQLRTPLSGILGYLSMLMEGDFGELEREEQRAVIQDVYDAGQRLAGLVDVFLHVSNIDAGNLKLEFSPVNVAQMVQTQLAQLDSMIQKKNISVELRVDTTKDYTVEADMSLHNVILNILDNAVRYSPDGAEVHIRLDSTEDSIQLKVEDTGVGLNDSEAAHLFEKFSRGSTGLQMHPNGSGLGLYIGKQIIAGHNGKLWIENKGEGVGIIAYVELPRHQIQEQVRLDSPMV